MYLTYLSTPSHERFSQKIKTGKVTLACKYLAEQPKFFASLTDSATGEVSEEKSSFTDVSLERFFKHRRTRKMC